MVWLCGFSAAEPSLIPHWLIKHKRLYLSPPHTCLIISFISPAHMSSVSGREYLTEQSAAAFLCLSTFINAWVCWHAVPSIVNRDIGWLINIIGQCVLMKEPETGAQPASLVLSSRISSEARLDEISFLFSSRRIFFLSLWTKWHLYPPFTL